MKRKLTLLALTAFTLAPQVLLASGAERPSCKVCGMYIDSHQKTAATLVSNKDGQQQSCGVTDMIRLVNDAGGPSAFSALTVHDWQSGREVAAQDATYVIGSALIPDMMPNLIAFASKSDADEFQKINGGAQLSFSQALLSISPAGMTMPATI